jgi:hypothetical protein
LGADASALDQGHLDLELVVEILVVVEVSDRQETVQVVEIPEWEGAAVVDLGLP